MLLDFFYTVLAYFIFRWLDRIFSGKRQPNAEKDTDKVEKAQQVNKNVGEYVKYEELNKDK